MGASPTTCRVHIAQLRGITKPSPLLVRLEACALRKRGLECPSVGIQPPNPTPLFGKVLNKTYPFYDLATGSMLYSLENKVD